MADADRLVAALRYQQEMEEANRPVTVNSWMARKAAAIKQNAPAENMLTQYAQTMPQNWQQFGQNMAQAYPTPATGASRDQIMGAVMQAAINAGPGITKMVAPQEQALRLAQQRAALPVEQHGLGLPPNNTAAQRAAATDFNTPAYHGTHSDVPVFDKRKNVTAKDIYSSPNPVESNAYAENLGGIGGNVMPLLLRGGVKDLTQESKYVENQLRKAYNAQVPAYERKYYPFEQFQDSFMRGQLYQETGGQSAQNALVKELIGNWSTFF